MGHGNYLNMTGTGVNFKMGLIVKPINELRLGVAFHTPTFFNVNSFIMQARRMHLMRMLPVAEYQT